VLLCRELPADEVAEDVLEGLEDGDRDSENSQPLDQGALLIPLLSGTHTCN